ncbi:serine/threonine protein kinase [Chondromyces apiculatus]|uniref:Serine/threonine protein kinase n=1 Tax=Chondromyces apiculatus DSM 436 TaxID=1192034 RepID=A0A017TEQ9_9BACT|nr:serine/threonine-protein kinase [Chondromyces apiculatus]EYF07734.1 serine/threonine protein kinase [Chondromyces apiculatus DSM 436]
MDQIGEYLVRRLIGEGGMGKVYEGEERLSRRRVALKVLRPELARSEQGRRLFLNEMQILAHLEHPNVVRSLASIEVNGELVMVLEYLDGRTLRDLLGADGRLPWTEAVRIASAVAAALAAAHGQEPPVIHRDLKPENIMILQDGSVKVMDFGIAKVIEALHQTNTQSVGTLQYMSPEQIDARSIDHRADLYCLGLVLYEMLAGAPPFQSASPRQLLNLQCTAEAPPLGDEVRTGLPRGVEQLLYQLLEKAPEDRPYMAEDVVERLEPFQPASPARGGRSTLPTPGARTSGASGSGAGRSSGAGSGSGAGSAARAGSGSGAGETVVGDGESTARDSGSGARGEGGEASAKARSGAGATLRDDGEDRGSAAEGGRGRGRETREMSAPPGKTPAPRADTIALLDKVDRPREVSTAFAVGIIVALSALAGGGAYVMRSNEPPTGPLPSATATVTGTTGAGRGP